MDWIKSSNFLVTGGAGFIGSNIVSELLALGAKKVAVFDNLSTGRLSNIKPYFSDIEFIEADLRDFDSVFSSMKSIDYVFHQAAIPSVPRSMKDPLLTTSVNVDGSVNLLHSAAKHGVKRVIIASSSSVYGDSDELPKHEAMPFNVLSPYAASKAALELYASSFNRTWNLETVCLRYFNVFGPNQDPNSMYAAVIPSFINALLKNDKLFIYGDGLQTRDFTYVGNVVRANLLAATPKGAPGKAMNIGSGRSVSLLRLIEMMSEQIGSSKPNVNHLPSRDGDVKHSLADISLARSILSYEPLYTLERALEITIEHLKKHINI